MILINSSLLLLAGFFLLLMTWWTSRLSQFIESHPFSFSFAAFILLLSAIVGIRSYVRRGSAYTFKLARGRSTFSLSALKRGIDTFLKQENPLYHLESLDLLDGGRTLHLHLQGDEKNSAPLLERLSSLLADQYGFEGQLEVTF